VPASVIAGSTRGRWRLGRRLTAARTAVRRSASITTLAGPALSGSLGSRRLIDQQLPRAPLQAPQRRAASGDEQPPRIASGFSMRRMWVNAASQAAWTTSSTSGPFT